MGVARQSTSTKLKTTKFSSKGLEGNSAKVYTSENFPLYGTSLPNQEHMSHLKGGKEHLTSNYESDVFDEVH